MGRKRKSEEEKLMEKYKRLDMNGLLDDSIPKEMYDCFVNNEYFGTISMYYPNPTTKFLRMRALDEYPTLENKEFIVVKQGTPLWESLTYGRTPNGLK